MIRKIFLMTALSFGFAAPIFAADGGCKKCECCKDKKCDCCNKESCGKCCGEEGGSCKVEKKPK